MSFGFSVGDIVLVSQMAYKLYSTLATGRKTAERRIKELEDVLFGLRCALDHLSKQAREIEATATSSHAADSTKMLTDLSTMVSSCGITLTELEGLFAKYGDGLKETPISVSEDQETSASAPKTASRISKSSSLVRAQKTLRINWMKIRWDVESDSLAKYREKLQSHTDAINIVLSTFLLSSTHRLETDGKANAQKMQDLQNQALKSNSEVLQLVQDLHRMLISSRALEIQSHVAPTPNYEAGENINSVSLMAFSGKVPIHPMPAPSPHSNVSSSHEIQNTPIIRRQERPIPPALQQLNQARSAVGSQQLQEYLLREDHRTQHAAPPLAAAQPTPTSLPTLQATIRSLLVQRSSSLDPQNPTSIMLRREIRQWAHDLNVTATSWTSTDNDNDTSFPSTPALLRARIPETVNLLAELNSAIDDLDARGRGVVYSELDSGGIKNVMDRMRRETRSVTVGKEIEEFEDEREEWMRGRVVGVLKG